MENNKSEIMVLSGDDYKTLEDKYNQELDKLLLASIELEKRKSEIKKLQLQLDTVNRHVRTFLDEFEAKFDSDEKCDSVEIANDYITAATYQMAFGRTNNRVNDVQKWIDNYLPFP